MIPFSLMWGGFLVLFGEFQGRELQGGALVLSILWGVPFVLVGLYMIVGRFFYEASAV